MEYITKGGAVLTDELIEELASQMESGNIPGAAGEWIVAPPGRPRLSEEQLRTVAFKIPQSEFEAMEALAKKRKQTRSAFMREALAAALANA